MDQAEWKRLRRELEPQERSWPTFAMLCLDALAFAAAWLTSVRGGAWMLASYALLVLVLLHAYLWVHEATHASLSDNKTLNDLLGHLAGFLIVLPYLSRRRSHMLHHVWTGHPTGDPANKRLIERFSVMTERQAAALERVWRSWVPLLALNDRVGLWRDASAELRRGNRKKTIERELIANYAYAVGYCALLGALLATGTLLHVLCLYVPAMLTQLFAEELVNAPHHAESPLLRPEDEALPFWQQHRVTHSCKRVPVWSPLVLLNFNLHTAHHFFPGAPWSSLPQIHRELARRMPELEAEQTTPHELAWSLEKRRAPILKLMGHYFDRVPRPGESLAERPVKSSTRPTERAMTGAARPPSLRPPPPQQAADR